MPAVPDRLKEAVSKPQRQNVLHGLFTEVMIAAVDLALVDDGRQLSIEGPRTLQVMPERLLDHNPAPRRLLLPGINQPSLTEPLDDRQKKLGCDGQVINPVSPSAMRLVRPIESFLE